MQRQESGARVDAESIGLAALVFLTEDGERLGRFLAATGISPGELKATAGTPEGQAGVLDYLLSDESLLMVFSAEAGIDPGAIAPAREELAGGGDAKRFAAENYTSGNTSGRSTSKRSSKRWAGPGT